MAKIMLLDDDSDFKDFLAEHLGKCGYELIWRESIEDKFKNRLSADEVNDCHVLLLDQRLDGGTDGTDFLAELKQQGLRTPVVLITGHGTPDLVIEAGGLGVWAFVIKPVEFDERSLGQLRPILDEAAKASRFMREPVPLPPDPEVGGMVGGCMSKVYLQIGKAAGNPDPRHPVLITGETGAGKEWAARMVFHCGKRKGRFLKVGCEFLHEKDLEEKLFGCRDSDPARIGAFEQARGGALLLDDLDRASPAVQEKVCQAIREGRVVPGGTRTPVESDVWVIGCAQREFVSELTQLCTRIHLPPLREREKEDLDELARFFLRQFAAERGSAARDFDGPALAALHCQTWPGNVRQLQEVIRQAVGRCRGEWITAADLKLGLGVEGDGEVSAYVRLAIQAARRSCQTDLFDLLKRILVDVLRTETQNSEEIARRTGLPAPDIDRILQELGCLPPPPLPRPAPRRLHPSRAKAWGLYLKALDDNPTLIACPYAQVFRWLEERLAGGLPPFESGIDGDRQGLPKKCDTFKRFVREARAHYPDSRNTSGENSSRPRTEADSAPSHFRNHV